MKALKIGIGAVVILSLASCSTDTANATPETDPSLEPTLSAEMLVVEEGLMDVAPVDGYLRWSNTTPSITLTGSTVLEEYDGLPAPEGHEIIAADFTTSIPLLGAVTADGTTVGKIDNALPSEGHIIAVAPAGTPLSLDLRYQDSPAQSLDLRSGERLSEGVLEGFYYEGADAEQAVSDLVLNGLTVKASSYDEDLPWTPDGRYLLDITMKPTSSSGTPLGECTATLSSGGAVYETRDGFFSGNIDFIVENSHSDFTLTSRCENGLENITEITVIQ